MAVESWDTGLENALKATTKIGSPHKHVANATNLDTLEEIALSK